MMFMNESEIVMMTERYRNHPVLSDATKFLREYMRQVDLNSDGWPYWSQPVRAAAKLMLLIQHPETATHAQFHKALTPIKSFYSRKGYAAGMQFPEIGVL